MADNQKSIILVDTNKHDSIAYEQMTEALNLIGFIIGKERCIDQTLFSLNSEGNTPAFVNCSPSPSPRYRKIRFLKNGILFSDAPSLGACALVAGIGTYILLVLNWHQIHFGIAISSIFLIVLVAFAIHWRNDFVEFEISNRIIKIHRILKRQEMRFSDIIGVISVSYYSSERGFVADIMLIHSSPAQKTLITSTNLPDEVVEVIELICQTVGCTCLAQI